MSYSVKFRMQISNEELTDVMLKDVGYDVISDNLPLTEMIAQDDKDPFVWYVDVNDTIDLHESLVNRKIDHWMDRNGQMFCEFNN